MYNNNELNFANHIRNMNLVQKAQEIINDFMGDSNYKLYIYDDAGNLITPVGKIHIVTISPIIKESKEGLKG